MIKTKGCPWKGSRHNYACFVSDIVEVDSDMETVTNIS